MEAGGSRMMDRDRRVSSRKMIFGRSKIDARIFSTREKNRAGKIATRAEMTGFNGVLQK